MARAFSITEELSVEVRQKILLTAILDLDDVSRGVFKSDFETEFVEDNEGIERFKMALDAIFNKKRMEVKTGSKIPGKESKDVEVSCLKELDSEYKEGVESVITILQKIKQNPSAFGLRYESFYNLLLIYADPKFVFLQKTPEISESVIEAVIGKAGGDVLQRFKVIKEAAVAKAEVEASRILTEHEEATRLAEEAKRVLAEKRQLKEERLPTAEEGAQEVGEEDEFDESFQALQTEIKDLYLSVKSAIKGKAEKIRKADAQAETESEEEYMHRLFIEEEVSKLGGKPIHFEETKVREDERHYLAFCDKYSLEGLKIEHRVKLRPSELKQKLTKETIIKSSIARFKSASDMGEGQLSNYSRAKFDEFKEKIVEKNKPFRSQHVKAEIDALRTDSEIEKNANKAITGIGEFIYAHDWKVSRWGSSYRIHDASEKQVPKHVALIYKITKDSDMTALEKLACIHKVSKQAVDKGCGFFAKRHAETDFAYRTLVKMSEDMDALFKP